MKNIIRTVIISGIFGFYALRAQTYADHSASVFIPIDHWMYSYITLLQDRGHLASLNPSVRPYTRKEVFGAVKKLNQTDLSSAEKKWIQYIREELSDVAEDVACVDTTLIRTSWEGRLSLRRQQNDTHGDYFVKPNLEISSDNFAIHLRARIDHALRRDTNYQGRKPSIGGAYLPDAYALLQWKSVRLTVGHYSTNWGPFENKSLIVSANPYPYERLELSWTTRRISIRSFVAQLDQAYNAGRYFSAHRMDIHLPHGINLGITESVIHGNADKTQPINWKYLNPINIFAEAQLNGGGDANENIAFDAYVPVGRFVFKGQFLVDDLILDGPDKPAPNRKTSPDRLGFLITGIINNPGLPSSQAQLDYERVSSYTYNIKSSRPWQSYTYNGLGLGSPRNDRDAWILTWRYFGFERWLLSLESGFFRQGERNLSSHDFTDSTMTVGKFPRGLVEKTWRLGIQADYFHAHNFWATCKISTDNVRNRSNKKTPLRHYLNVFVSLNYQIDRYLNI